jgi:hypothetical protein
MALDATVNLRVNTEFDSESSALVDIGVGDWLCFEQLGTLAWAPVAYIRPARYPQPLDRLEYVTPSGVVRRYQILELRKDPQLAAKQIALLTEDVQQGGKLYAELSTKYHEQQRQLNTAVVALADERERSLDVLTTLGAVREQVQEVFKHILELKHDIKHTSSVLRIDHLVGRLDTLEQMLKGCTDPAWQSTADKLARSGFVLMQNDEEALRQAEARGQ